MIPKKYDAHEYDYPDFQPDQVLSADHLNHSFAFNEQQERLTRSNLIGIGIVCGLKISKSANGKIVTISKGTGVTSQGYLMAHGKENSEESIDYKKYRSFSAEIIKDKKYDVLVTGITPRYTIWELLDDAAAEATDPELTEAFLSNKVCLLYYEMLEVDAKNCDTTSCDDKGKTVTITVRKLLVNVTDADKITLELNNKAQASGSGEVFPGINTLPEIRLPRFDVLASSPVTTSDIYKAYQKIFTKAFVEATGTALNSAYNIFKAYLKDNSNPFANFNSTFAFLHNTTITGNDLLHFQYYWDFFCDLIAAYNEWRVAAQPLGAMCTPPEALFPRHLFLGYFGEAESIVKSKYRNYFIPSPALSYQEEGYKEFKNLFQRLVRMITAKNLPLPSVYGTATADGNIRITPSVLGTTALGTRAIPYYYKNNEAPNKLVDVWNHAETKRGRQNLLLSYYPAYNTTDDFVRNPLKYDLEPYNFFRVEGHIGKAYTGVLGSLKKLINDNRLPINVVALELSTDSANTQIDDACGIAGIQMQYDILRNELRCCLKKDINYWSQLIVDDKPQDTRETNGWVLATGFLIGFEEMYMLPVDTGVQTVDLNLNKTLKDVELKYGTRNPKAVDEFKKFLKSANETKIDASSSSNKVDLFKNTVTHYSSQSMAGKYMERQKNGDISINKIPAAAATATGDTFSHLVLTIIDEMQDILLLLQADDILDFDLDKLALHIEALKKAYKELEERIAGLSDTEKAVSNMKATLGEAFNSQVDAIAAAIPNILSKNANTIVLLLLNPPTTASNHRLVLDLKAAATDAAKQKVIDEAFSKVDRDGMSVPIKREVSSRGDEILKDLRDHIKNKGCLCGYESLKTLHELLKKEIDALKKLNLFSEFIKKHPGIQHKAGVTTGGTFIIAYHRKSAATLPVYDNVVKAFAEGIVIADFYLPYLCNSDCQPVNFNIVIPVPPLSLGLPKTEYCVEDATPEYLFTANPTGGKLVTTDLQKDSLKDNGDGTYAFLPSKVVIANGAKDATVTFTYTLGDQMQTLNIKVYAYPKVKIIATPAATNPLKVDFTLDNPAIASGATWQFGDGTTGTGISTARVYTAGASYTVGCTVQNGVCTFIADTVVVDVKDPEPVDIGLKQTGICRDAEPVSFTVTPAGGTATGEGFTESPAGSGKFKFTPSAVQPNGTPQKTVTFNYTPLAGNPKSVAITVFEKPQANTGFRVIVGNGTDAQFIFAALRNATTLEIDFNDGKDKGVYNVSGLTAFTTPSHLFPGAGPFNVSAVLINGTCTLPFAAVPVAFEIKEERPKVCQSLKIPLKEYLELEKQLLKLPEFISAYNKARMDSVSKFFTNLALQLREGEPVPVSFFAQNPLMPDWVEALPVTNERTRALSIRLLAIFTDVATTISCLMETDIDGSRISTSVFLNTIIAKILQLKKLSDDDKKLTDAIVNDANDELKLLDDNREAQKKKAFVDALMRILEAIKKIS